MTQVYFFDDYQQLIKVVDHESLIEVTQEKEITSNKSELMNNVLNVICQYDEAIKEAGYMAVRENESSFSMYRILVDSDSNNRLNFQGVDFAPDELDSYIVDDIRPSNESVSSICNRLMNYTEGEWRVGYVDPLIKTITTNFYYISIRESLKSLQEFGCEVVFKCNLTGQGAIDKWIEVYKEIGEDSNYRFDYGDNALEVVKERNRTSVYTSLIGRGKGEEVGDGHGRRIEFKDVEWTSPLKKPKGQNWIEYPKMTALFGIPSKNGKMRKREQVVIFEDIEDPKELLQKTYEKLLETCRPLVQFKTSVLGGDTIGNYVTIHRYDRNYHYRTRIFKTKVDLLTGKVECSLGDQLTSSLSRQTSNIQNGLSTLDEKKMTFYQSTEIGKYQDDIMRGAGKNGGSIYLVNGIEAGVSNSRESYEQVFMDGPKIELSEHFMIQNSEGISFKQCKKGEWTTIKDVHNGDSNTAWTLDGTFVADFIQAGTLSAIDIRGVNIYGSKIETINDGQFGMLRMENGTIQFFDKKGKSFGLLTLTNLEKPSILLQHNDGSFFMDADSATITHSKMINLNAPKVLKNGVEIGSGTPGTGSAGNEGGWNGTYPSVADTQAKKFAWEAWTTLRGLGYSEAASAGILGNINGEAGPSMNPDTDQIDGPAYGAVQFDGSSSTIVGSLTDNGREYFQRLHKASGVGGDYKTMSVQMAVVNWTMTNGQWIGKINPTSVSGYKAMTDARTAATVFERNFERPASTHPERSNYAQYWYDLFKGVAIEKKDWVNPIRVPYLIWQEWNNIQDDGKIHGGIDITPKNGASSAVYAARAGTVYQVVPNDPAGGNYMVVKHSDGYYTYYGHFASMSAKVGDNVTTDTVLGMSGQTGRATGIHLHFEVWKGGEWQRINPRDVIKF